jgi:hypothetical protein
LGFNLYDYPVNDQLVSMSLYQLVQLYCLYIRLLTTEMTALYVLLAKFIGMCHRHMMNTLVYNFFCALPKMRRRSRVSRY